MTTLALTPDQLTATTDLAGATIAVGTRVRSYDFPHMTGDGELRGFDLTGERASFIEGVIDTIGEDQLDGCPR